MADLVIRAVDGLLAERIRRVAEARGWTVGETISRLLEHGLFVVEAEVRGGFSDREVDALAEAIDALRQVPQGRHF